MRSAPVKPGNIRDHSLNFKGYSLKVSDKEQPKSYA